MPTKIIRRIPPKFGPTALIYLILVFNLGDYIEFFNKTGKRALHEAAQNDRHDIAQFLISKGEFHCLLKDFQVANIRSSPVKASSG